MNSSEPTPAPPSTGQRPSGWTRQRALITGAVLGFAAVLVAVPVAMSSVGSRTVTPNLAGVTVAAAEAAVSDAGMTVTVDRDGCRQQSIPDELCVVLSQTPPADTRARLGEQVTLVLGPAEVEVPDLIGKTYAEAVATLDELGLRADLSHPISIRNAAADSGSAVAAFTVVSQQETPGTEVPAMQAVQLRLDLPEVTVPNVVGLQIMNAGAAIRAAGINPKVQPTGAPDVATVLSQQPAAGATALWGSDVVLAAGVAVPSVALMTFEQAREVLAEAGLHPQTTATSPRPVIGTNPAQGTLVEAGTRVEILQAAPEIVFSVVSDGGEALITWAPPGSISIAQESPALLPWSKSFPSVGVPQHLRGNLSAQTSNGTWIECTIKVDGEVVDQQRSTGQYAVVMCGG